MAEEILNLSTVVERPTINVTSKKHKQGKLYELVNLADLGPFEHAAILQRQQELAPLRKLKKLTEPQKRQVKKMLDDMVVLLCPTLEPMVLKELTDEQKEMIIVVWSAHVTVDTGAAEGNRQSRRTTAARSRGSRSSTASAPYMKPETHRAVLDKYERILDRRPPRATLEMLESMGFPVRRVPKKKKATRSRPGVS
jgi:hypothetical protein